MMNNTDDNIRKAAMEEAAQIDNVLSATQAKELEKGCKAMFDLYTNYVKAGFTPGQAMQLVCTVLSTAAKGGKA